jgi:hypothetical protein
MQEIVQSKLVPWFLVLLLLGFVKQYFTIKAEKNLTVQSILIKNSALSISTVLFIISATLYFMNILSKENWNWILSGFMLHIIIEKILFMRILIANKKYTDKGVALADVVGLHKIKVGSLIENPETLMSDRLNDLEDDGVEEKRYAFQVHDNILYMDVRFKYKSQL